ncbi:MULTISPECIES: hypothetical protein [Enterobacter]|uniref:hypothetical protein n=1 Tax=Enterobacter TaxID=547 RepID=UPI0009020522|nr:MULTISPECIES: hypothetical protein [Enterobacter]EKS6337574.1 hypothetical protein [Enterobacter hormaechei]VAL43497.1 Uncharacterised protein [Enterobacter kobei]
MTKVYTTWHSYETQVYDQQCGDNTEGDFGTATNFNKKVGAGFIMDAPGKNLVLNDGQGIIWPSSPQDPEELPDTVTEFGIFSGKFGCNTHESIFMGKKRSFSLVLQRDGSMELRADSIISTESDAGSNGFVGVEMYDCSSLNLSSNGFIWDGTYSINDSATLNISAQHVIPHDHLTQLYGTSEVNVVTNLIKETADPWRISLFQGTPQLNIMALSKGGDPLNSSVAEVSYPQGIIDFTSVSRGTVVLDVPVANTFILNILNSRGTFAVDGKVTNIAEGNGFKFSYGSDVQRNGFTTGTITITKVR